MKKEQICSFIYYNCKGKSKALGSSKIEQMLRLSSNELRKQINRLRRDGIPIASDSDGYYFAANAAEVYSTIRSLSKMRDGIDSAIKGLERAMDKFSALSGGDAG